AALDFFRHTESEMNTRMFLFAALLASCASAPLRPAELRASLPVQYWVGPSQELAWGVWGEDREVAGERSIRISAAVSDARVIAADLGGRVTPFAGIVSAADAARFLTAGGARDIAPRLTLLDGQRSSFLIMRPYADDQDTLFDDFPLREHTFDVCACFT